MSREEETQKPRWFSGETFDKHLHFALPHSFRRSLLVKIQVTGEKNRTLPPGRKPPNAVCAKSLPASSLLHRLFVVVPLLRVRPIQLGRGEDEDDFCSFRADSPSVTSVSGEDEQDRVPEQEFPPFFFPRSTAVVLKGKTKGRTESLPPLCSHFPPPQK